MQPNIIYSRAGAARNKKHRKKKQKNYFIVLMAVFVFIVSIKTVAMKSPEKALSDGKESGCFTSEIRETNSGQSSSPDKEFQNSKVSEETSVIPGYDYSKPVPESQTVENSYFDDAVFIGDSRTEGLILYTGLSNTVAYTDKGLMVDTVFTKPAINKNGEKISVMEALRSTDFRKVYIMLGINETGWPYSSVFIEKYGRIIDEIKAVNPQAIIYVQEILPVTESVSQTSGYVKNKKIDEYNALIRQMAEEKQVYYIDTGNAVADENGFLPEDAAIDGIHLKQPYCRKWLEYLKTHTVAYTER